MSLLFAIDTPFFDANGAPLAFGTVYFGQPNQDAVSNPKVPYTDDTFGTPLSATQELTIGGKFAQEIWLNGDYSIVIKDADDVQVAEYMLVPEPEASATVAWGDISGTLSAQTDLQAALDAKQAALTPGDFIDITSNVISGDFSVDDTDASYTLSNTNFNQWMDLTGSGTIDITCPPESSVDLGAKFNHVVSNYSSGTVTIVAGSGVTVRPPTGGTLVIPQYATVGIKKASYAADTYIVYGPTEAA